MTPYVLTLIGNAKSQLEPIHIDQVFQHLGHSGEIDWLAQGEACDLFIHSDLSVEVITGKAREALNGLSIDAVCTPQHGRRKKLLISDMDSTIIDQECVDELADAMGLGAKVREITAAGIRGDISFPQALRKRLKMMQGMEEKILQSVYENRITIKTGARTLVQTMRHHGAFCILVSGGFTYFTRRISTRLGFHDHQGNALIFANGKLSGEVEEPILGRAAKLETLAAICKEKSLTFSEVLAVGDGANDLEMIEAAGMGVAFHDNGSLRTKSNACIDHGDLTALL